VLEERCEFFATSKTKAQPPRQLAKKSSDETPAAPMPNRWPEATPPLRASRLPIYGTFARVSGRQPPHTSVADGLFSAKDFPSQVPKSIFLYWRFVRGVRMGQFWLREHLFT